MLELLGTILGFLAGAVMIGSGLPLIRAQLRRGEPSTQAERSSRLLMVLGNGLWVANGILTDHPAILAMAAVQCVIQMAILLRMMKNRNR